MSVERAGAIALITGSAVSLLVIAFHPTHVGTASTVIHAIGIATAPITLFGAVVLSRFLGFHRPLPLLATAYFAIGTCAIVAAAAMSGFVMPALANDELHDEAILHDFAHFTFALNQAAANVYTALVSLALLIFAMSWRSSGTLAQVTRWSGLVIALAVLGWQLTGNLELDIHGMGVVMVGHAAWLVVAAVTMWRSGPSVRA